MPAETRRELAPGHQDSESDLQGLTYNHENQSSTSGQLSTPATMDDPPSQPAPPAAPQIRSRITVVCAECKRLKLKCDRLMPCGSCMKRNTVVQCIYSPAAAEKVDLHALNNRLMQVEMTLAMVTAGKTPPPFQSSYPHAQVAIPVTKSRAHLATPPLPSPISIQSDDLTNIWLAHCQLDLTNSWSKSGQTSDGNCVKLEPSPVDILSTPFHENPIVIKDLPPTTTPNTHLNLPPIHAYYLSSSTQTNIVLPQAQGQATRYTHPLQISSPSDAFPRQRDYEFPPSTHTPLLLRTSQLSKPSATATIFALLPAPASRTKLLSRARAAHPYITLVTHWGRILELADGGEKSTLARAIFGFDSSSKVSNSESTTSASQGSNLPLFACLCYALALGALELNADVSADPAFLSALAGQALWVWEQYTTDSKEIGKDGGDDGRLGKEAERDKEDDDHLVAGLLHVKYLLHSSQRDITSGLEAIFPLIGQLVNEARGLGFERDPEKMDNVNAKRSAKNEERRRMIWWDIMFYDSFVSDALCQPALISLSSYSTRLPTIAQVPSSSASGFSTRKFQPRGVDDGEGGAELEPSIEGGEREGGLDKDVRNDQKVHGHSKGRVVSKGAIAGKGKGKAKVSGPAAIVDDTESGFFGVRCRLTRLMQGIKNQLSRPGCECSTCGNGSGYTLDQAVKLEGDIRIWVNELPQPLKRDSGSTDQNLAAEQSMKQAALATELAILANRLIISVYLPLMRPSVEPGMSTYAAMLPWNPASRATLDAAKGIVRASRVLQRLLDGAGGALSMSMMEQYYPLDKAVLDAVVICAHSAFGVKAQGKAVTEVSIGLDIIAALGGGNGETRKTVAALRSKLEGMRSTKTEDNVLKRKHDLVGVLGNSHGEQGLMGAHCVDLGSPYESKASGGTLATQDGTHPASQLSHQELPQIPPRSSTPHRPRTKDSVGKEKDKKKGKKGNTVYPAVGIRDRGKEGAPWMFKRASSTSVKSQPSTEPRAADAMHAPPTFGENAMDYGTPDASQPPSHTVPAQNRAPSAIQQDHAYRSRSSSVSQGIHTNDPVQSVEYPILCEQHPGMHIDKRRRFSIQDTGHLPQGQPQVQVFSVSPTSIYDSIQQPPHAESFDPPRGYDQHRASFDQNSVSSPYPISSTSMSTTSSPYSSTSKAPPTPTFGQPQMVNANPQTYFHTPSAYDPSSYNRHGLQLGPGTSVAMDPAMGSHYGGEISPTPIYDDPQVSVYDPKPLGQFGPQQQQQMMHTYQSAGDTSRHQTTMVPCDSQATWSAPPQYLQQQQQPPPADEQYWDAGSYYREPKL